MNGSLQGLTWERAVGLSLVLILHVAVLWGLMQHQLIPMPDKIAPLFVNFIEPPQPPPEPPKPKVEPPKPKVEPPKPVKFEKPIPPDPHPHLAVEAPARMDDYVATPPPPLPPAPVVIEEPPAPPLKPAEPIMLSGELSVGCPSRHPPAYPPLSKRLGEVGKVVLRVELAVDGRVELASVMTSSGFKRLDDAALTAVKTWRCNPPRRGGEAVRAVALQPFDFNLE